MKGRIHSLESFGTVDGPGVRYVVFFQGCPMRCLYCHNPDTWTMTGGTEMEAAQIIEQYERNKSFYKNGGITATGGEPLMQIDFLTELFAEAKRRGIHTCLDTSGFPYNESDPVMMEKMDRLMEVTDLIMLDIKHIDPILHKKLTAQPNSNILAFAEYTAMKGTDLWIRHVVVPGFTDDDNYLFQLGYFIGGLTNLKALDVLPYHTMGKAKYKQLNFNYPLADTPPM
ncbi:MAG TPA: pyruvate formate-lyase-activating protein, partial [Lachnospiraceae bacterium]|nr:pyruvate formate-lyase-activating protein [Lachnospiraceae bacterium]